MPPADSDRQDGSRSVGASLGCCVCIELSESVLSSAEEDWEFNKEDSLLVRNMGLV